MSNSTLQDEIVTKKPSPRPAADLDTPEPLPAVTTAAAPTAPAVPSFMERYKKPALIVAAVVAAIAIAFYAYDSFTHEETDDAYVTGHLHSVSPRISEVVTDVLVDDNQFVHKGDALVKLDPSDYLALGLALTTPTEKSRGRSENRRRAAPGHSRSTTAGSRCGLKLPYSYNVDEATHFVPRAIAFFSHDLNPQYFLNPPAYSYLLHIVFELWFGSGDAVSRAFTTDPTQVFVVARVVAAVLGTISVWLTYLAGERLFGRTVALLGAAIFSVAFLPIFYSHLALNDVPTLAPVALGAVRGIRASCAAAGAVTT